MNPSRHDPPPTPWDQPPQAPSRTHIQPVTSQRGLYPEIPGFAGVQHTYATNEVRPDDFGAPGLPGAAPWGQNPEGLTYQHVQDSFPPSTSSKRALVIGCNYPGTRDELKSCVNDASNMKFMLQEHFHFNEADVRILADAPDVPEGWLPPTRQNIIKYMKLLVKGAKAGDSLFFHFSGHGTESKDYSGDEANNQCLMPTDYQDAGLLVDDDINRFLVRPLPAGCKLHALVDCCHSGTIMDLQFEAKNGGWQNHGASSVYKGTNGGQVFQFAACHDGKRAYGDEKDPEGMECFGAATDAFISALTNANSQARTYAQVLYHMEQNIKQKCRKKNFLQVLKKYQKPQLSSNTDDVSLNTTIEI